MKIIDLLNKIANGEKVPKKIKWEDTIYAYSDYDKDYLKFPFSEEKYQGLFCMKDSILTQFLNDEVEILEEEKKIPKKIDHLIGYDIRQFDDLKEYVEITTNDLFGKVNKVIDTLNQVIDYLKSKGE